MANINLGHIKGDAGQGINSGGASGQFLSKNTNTDYDTVWTNPPTGLFSPSPVERIYYYNTYSTTATYTDKNGNVSNLSWTWVGSTCRITIPQALLDGEIHELTVYCFSNSTNPSFQLVSSVSTISTRIYNGGFDVNTTGLNFANNTTYTMWIKKE